jgi:sugar phosphate isomerase/epimerase
MNKFILFLICLFSTLSGFAQSEKVDWPLYAYNFGGLRDKTPEEQITILKKNGFDGISLMANYRNSLVDLSPFIELTEADPEFHIYSVFFRYNFNDDDAVKTGYRSIIDQISGKDIAFWMIFGRPAEGFTEEHIESVLRDVVAYGEGKGVKITLYPHHHHVIPTGEEALNWLDKIHSPNLDIVFHTCHELRSGNASRVEEILELAGDRLGHVTIAGADTVIDFTDPISIENSSIKPLYRGSFDNSRVLKKLKDVDYQGSVGFINHLIKEDPDVYLSGSRKIYDKWLAELNKPKIPEFAYDAPDQCTYHAPSNTWFVSNLGGGISLDRDSYGWITRIDAFGNILEDVWIGLEEGMHAPSGMTITDQYLYVCDRDGVHEIDIEKREIVNFFPLPEGEFINDIAMAENGDLYVSDFFGNRIFRIPADTREGEIWLETDRLETPDGLYMDGNNLIVASWGPLSEPGTFKTSKPGDLLRIDLNTKEISVISREVGNLEGITKAGKYYYLTDWAAGTLIRVDSKKGTIVDVLKGLLHPTDPMYSEELGVIAFPQHGKNQVLMIQVDEMERSK